MPRMDLPKGDFLKWFMQQCARTDMKISDLEEKQRYDIAPWYDRMMNKLNKWEIWRKAPKND